MSGDEIKCENGLHENDADEKDERTVDKPTPIPIQYLLNVGHFTELQVLKTVSSSSRCFYKGFAVVTESRP